MRRIVILALATVALSDAFSVIAVHAVGFHFGWRGPFLLVIYMLAGYAARRIGGLGAAMSVGLTAAAVDAVASLSWALGSGRVPDEYPVANLVTMAMLIPVFGALAATVGGFFAHPPHRPAAA
jgi:hypothetical protein